jgi:hypothetical protein
VLAFGIWGLSCCITPWWKAERQEGANVTSHSRRAKES